MNERDADAQARLRLAREVLDEATRVATSRPLPASGDETRRDGRRSERTAARPDRGRPDQGVSDVEETARTVALNQLNHSPHTRAQLEQAMAKKDVPPDVAQRVLDRFEQVGLVDDTAYAAMLVRTRQSERGLARRALAMELRRKGIDDETAADALDQVDSAVEEDAARALVSKRLRTMTSLADDVKRRRLVAMLARKGYSPGLGYRLVDEALRGADEGPLT